MEPGRELDKLIGEKVMGWHVSPWRDETDGGDSWFDTDGNYQAPYSIDENPRWRWSPSTDIAAAWTVVGKLADMGYVVSVCWGPGLDGQRYASVQMQLDIALIADLAFRNPRDMDAVGETVPLAICLAALKTVGVEVKDD